MEEKDEGKMTRGQKAWATRKANEAKKKAAQTMSGTFEGPPEGLEASVEFKKVTAVEQAEAPGRKLLDIADILKLNMQDLVNYAESIKIDTYSKTRADILVELGVTQL